MTTAFIMCITVLLMLIVLQLVAVNDKLDRNNGKEK